MTMMPRLPQEVLAHSFRFLGRNPQLGLRLVCREFGEVVVVEALAPEWSVCLPGTGLLRWEG